MHLHSHNTMQSADQYLIRLIIIRNSSIFEHLLFENFELHVKNFFRKNKLQLFYFIERVFDTYDQSGYDILATRNSATAFLYVSSVFLRKTLYQIMSLKEEKYLKVIKLLDLPDNRHEKRRSYRNIAMAICKVKRRFIFV